MSDIIFSKVYETVFSTANNINNTIDKIEKNDLTTILYSLPKYYFVYYVFIGFLIFFVINRLTIRLNHILTFLIVSVVIYFLLKSNSKSFYNYVNANNSKLKFLHKMLFPDKNFINNLFNNSITIKPQNFFKKSYLYLNMLVVNLFYDCRDYSTYNVSAYINSLSHCNNVLGISYNLRNGIEGTFYNYTNKFYDYSDAADETKKALNEYASLIYSVPLDKYSYDTLEKNTLLLQSILYNELKEMNIILKNRNKNVELNIYEVPNDMLDSVFSVDADNTKEKGYVSSYDVY